MGKNGNLYSWRPIQLFKKKGNEHLNQDPYPKFVEKNSNGTSVTYWYQKDYFYYYGNESSNLELGDAQSPIKVSMLVG